MPHGQPKSLCAVLSIQLSHLQSLALWSSTCLLRPAHAPLLLNCAPRSHLSKKFSGQVVVCHKISNPTSSNLPALSPISCMLRASITVWLPTVCPSTSNLYNIDFFVFSFCFTCPSHTLALHTDLVRRYHSFLSGSSKGAICMCCRGH